MAPLRSYLICSAPRTGSTLLEHALEATGAAGHPKEYFDYNHEALWTERLQLTPENYFEKIFEAGSTPNGVFAAKLFWFQTRNLCRKLGNPSLFTSDTAASLDAYFPNVRYVWLTRHDKVRQAVSYFKTDITNVWWVLNDRPAPAMPDEATIRASFNFDRINRYYTECIDADVNWYQYFERRGITPFKLAYEDLISSYDATISRLLWWLEIPLPQDYQIAAPRLVKQADAISEEWAERFTQWKNRHP